MNVKVVLAADINYFVPAATTIQSAINSSSSENEYNFYVLTSDIDITHQQKLKTLEKSNCKIDFIDVTNLIYEIKNLGCRHLTKETLYRLFIPELFPQDEKILYIDSDMIIHDDLAKVYGVDITGYDLAACMDVASDYTIGHYSAFMTSEPCENFCAGLILINNSEFIKHNVKDRCIKLLVDDDKNEHRLMTFMDQDALNVVCHRRVKFLDLSWNFQSDVYSHNCTDTIRNDVYRNAYLTAMKNRKVTHYNGHRKPWLYTNVGLAGDFWKVEKTLDFHNELTMIQDKYWEKHGRDFPFWNVERNSKLVIYGAGNNGKCLYDEMYASDFADIVMVIDKKGTGMDGKVFPVEKITEIDYDTVIIAIEKEKFVVQAYESLISLGVIPDKIKWIHERKHPW